MSFGYGLDFEEVANEEEIRVTTSDTTNLICLKYEPGEGFETDIVEASKLRKWQYGAVDDDTDGDGTRKAARKSPPEQTSMDSKPAAKES